VRQDLVVNDIVEKNRVGIESVPVQHYAVFECAVPADGSTPCSDLVTLKESCVQLCERRHNPAKYLKVVIFQMFMIDVSACPAALRTPPTAGPAPKSRTAVIVTCTGPAGHCKEVSRA
jgi:hypothetical protein